METSIIGLILLIMSAQMSYGQPGLNPANRTFTAAEQEIINLSKDKWQWMSEKNADILLKRITLLAVVGDNERCLCSFSLITRVFSF